MPKKTKIQFFNSYPVSFMARTDVSLRNATKISSRKTTGEGYLLVSGVVSRPGVYQYYAGELDVEFLPDHLKNAKPDSVVRVLYPDDAVFDQGHLDSIGGQPVTWGHPYELVNSRNIMFFQRGRVEKKVKKSKALVKADMVIQDAGLIDAINNDGLEQLSTGVQSNIEWTKGTDPNYGDYDGVVSDIRVNHVAVVDRARAGSEVRLDNQKPKQEGLKMEKEIVINGVTFKVTNQVAQAVEQVRKEQSEQAAEVKKVKADLQNAQKEKDALQGKFDALKERMENLDDLVSERQTLVNSAKALMPKVKTKGVSNDEIMKAVVTELSNGSMDGKSADYIQAKFDTLVELQSEGDGKKEANVLKNALENGEKKRPGQEAYDRRMKRFKDAWKTKAQQSA